MDCKKFLIPVDKPYEKVVGVNKNPHYARLLLDPYGGGFGELSAINTYIYQHFILNEKYCCFALAMEQIAISEMKHLELLGDTIITLGGNPIYTNRIGQPWTANNVNYTMNPKKILIDNILAEKKAIAEYEKLINAIPIEKVQNLLSRIIEDELAHIEAFKNMLSVITFN